MCGHLDGEQADGEGVLGGAAVLLCGGQALQNARRAHQRLRPAHARREQHAAANCSRLHTRTQPIFRDAYRSLDIVVFQDLLEAPTGRAPLIVSQDYVTSAEGSSLSAQIGVPATACI